VAGAELVVTVTPAREPLLEAEWLHPSATVVAVGSDGGGKRELGDSVLAAAVLSVCDNRERASRQPAVSHSI
jgi:ornithine cyclodeaminase